MTDYSYKLEVTQAEFLYLLGTPEIHGWLDKSESNYDTHRCLLWLGLNLTKGRVTELGSGLSSTPLLRQFCHGTKRPFYSFDNNQDWALKTGSTFVENWDGAKDPWEPCALLFIDHAPGEHRRSALERMKDKAQIIVIHDTELIGAGDYRVESVIQTFKYSVHYNRTGGGAGASAVSNTIDLNQFRGHKLGEFILE